MGCNERVISGVEFSIRRSGIHNMYGGLCRRICRVKLNMMNQDTIACFFNIHGAAIASDKWG